MTAPVNYNRACPLGDLLFLVDRLLVPVGYDVLYVFERGSAHGGGDRRDDAVSTGQSSLSLHHLLLLIDIFIGNVLAFAHLGRQTEGITMIASHVENHCHKLPMQVCVANLHGTFEVRRAFEVLFLCRCKSFDFRLLQTILSYAFY